MNSAIVAPPLSGGTIVPAGEGFVLAEWQDAGGPAGQRRLIAPLHLHHHDDEAWYVLEGLLCVQTGDTEVRVPAGSAVLVPRGTPHTYWNPGPDRVRYLLVMTSNIYRLIQAIHASSDRSAPALRGLFQKHDSELLDS
jgi:mannose-6-phosphate isomerase-like protein (cupin superfamily)